MQEGANGGRGPINEVDAADAVGRHRSRHVSLLLTPHYLNHVEREHAQECSTMRGQSARPDYEGQRRAFPVERLRPPALKFSRDYAAAISRVALTGSFSTLQRALKFASRGLT